MTNEPQLSNFRAWLRAIVFAPVAILALILGSVLVLFKATIKGKPQIRVVMTVSSTHFFEHLRPIHWEMETTEGGWEVKVITAEENLERLLFLRREYGLPDPIIHNSR